MKTQMIGNCIDNPTAVAVIDADEAMRIAKAAQASGLTLNDIEDLAERKRDKAERKASGKGRSNTIGNIATVGGQILDDQRKPLTVIHNDDTGGTMLLYIDASGYGHGRTWREAGITRKGMPTNEMEAQKLRAQNPDRMIGLVPVNMLVMDSVLPSIERAESHLDDIKRIKADLVTAIDLVAQMTAKGYPCEAIEADISRLNEELSVYVTAS